MPQFYLKISNEASCLFKLDTFSGAFRKIAKKTLNFEVRHPRCVEPKLQNGKNCFDFIFAIL